MVIIVYETLSIYEVNSKKKEYTHVAAACREQNEISSYCSFKKYSPVNVCFLLSLLTARGCPFVLVCICVSSDVPSYSEI